jgi:hypothetical protein
MINYTKAKERYVSLRKTYKNPWPKLAQEFGYNPRTDLGRFTIDYNKAKAMWHGQIELKFTEDVKSDFITAGECQD